MHNPRQQAKLAVLHHIGKLMDGMMGAKLKTGKGHAAGIKPVAAHMEVDMIPKDKMHGDGIDGPEMPPSMEKPEMPNDDEEQDRQMLADHYSSLK